jgi:DNA modification methylase
LPNQGFPKIISMRDKNFEMQTEKLHFHTEQRKVIDLIPYEKNPRFLTPQQEIDLTESLSKFSLAEIPVIDTDNKLIAGHQRVKILLKLGRGEDVIDVRVPNRKLTQKEFDEYNIRSNANTGSWNVEMLSTEFALSDLENWGLEATKLKGFATPVMVDEENDIPLSASTPLVKRGDIFKLGHHILMCGDAKSGSDVTALMQGQLAKMVFTDPPYNVKISSIGSSSVFDKTINKNRKQTTGIKQIHGEFVEASGEMLESEFTDFLSVIITNLIEHSEDGAIHFICMDWRHIQELLSASKMPNYAFKQLCVWNKDNAGMGTFYRSKHEFVFVFKKGQGKHINNFELGQYGRYRTNVWDYPIVTSFSNINKGESKLHPTVKPLDLVADAILDCSNHKDLILDLFLGSGTTLIASERTGRVCYGMELDPRYVEVSIQRFYHYMAQQSQTIDFEHLNGSLTLEQIVENGYN